MTTVLFWLTISVVIYTDSVRIRWLLRTPIIYNNKVMFRSPSLSCELSCKLCGTLHSYAYFILKLKKLLTRSETLNCVYQLHIRSRTQRGQSGPVSRPALNGLASRPIVLAFGPCHRRRGACYENNFRRGAVGNVWQVCRRNFRFV